MTLTAQIMAQVDAWHNEILTAEQQTAAVLQTEEAPNLEQLKSLAARGGGLYVTPAESAQYHQRLYDARLRSAALVTATEAAFSVDGTFDRDRAVSVWLEKTSTAAKDRIQRLIKSAAPKGAACKPRGVSYDAKRGLWDARITTGGRTKRLGRFATEEEAAAAVAAVRRPRATKYIGVSNSIEAWGDDAYEVYETEWFICVPQSAECVDSEYGLEEQANWYCSGATRNRPYRYYRKDGTFEECNISVLPETINGVDCWLIGTYRYARSAAEAYDDFASGRLFDPCFNFPRAGEKDAHGRRQAPAGKADQYERAFRLFSQLDKRFGRSEYARDRNPDAVSRGYIVVDAGRKHVFVGQDVAWLLSRTFVPMSLEEAVFAATFGFFPPAGAVRHVGDPLDYSLASLDFDPAITTPPA